MAIRPDPVLPRRARRPNPWASRDYRMLLFGMGPAMAGIWLQQIALSWLVLEIGGTAFDLGLVQTVSALPMLLFGLLGGAIADMVNRKRLVMFTRGGMGVLYSLLGIVTLLGFINIPIILVIVGAAGILMAFDLPARQSMVPQLVEPEDEAAAIAWLSTVANASRVAGPAIGGVLLGLIGPAYCFLLCGLGYLIMSFMTAQIKRDTRPHHTSRKNIGRDILTGLEFVVKTPVVLGLMAMFTCMTVFWQAHVTLLPVIARDILFAGASGFGLLSAASGVGALAGALFVAIFSTMPRQGWALFLSGVVACVILGFWAGLDAFVPSLLLLLFATIFGSGFQTLGSTLIQRQIPSELQGRVMSVFFVSWGFTPLGVLLAGGLSDLRGPAFSILILTSISLVSTIAVFVASPGMRRL